MLLAGCAGNGATIDLYPGYGTTDTLYVEGRVVERTEPAAAFTDADAARDNFTRTTSGFLIDEVEGREVSLSVAGGGEARAVSDDDGYVAAALDAPATPGWTEIAARGADLSATGEALVVASDSVIGIVSDIDDTVMITEVGDLWRMLGNTLFLNPLQREAVPGVAALYACVLARNSTPAAAPMFYLSSSPDQLDGYLRAFLEANDLPRGALITRRIDFDGEGDPLRDAVAYKSAEIETLFARVPDVPFVLVGDDGEHDPAVYALMRERHPERVAAIWIRRTRGDAGPALPDGQRALDEAMVELAPSDASAPCPDARGALDLPG